MSNKARRRLIRALNQLTERFDLEQDRLMDCIREAYREGKSNCGDLEIVLRQKDKKSAMFLFTEKGDPIMQFPFLIRDLELSNKSRFRYYWR